MLVNTPLNHYPCRMLPKFIGITLLLAFATTGAFGQAAGAYPEGVEVRDYTGWSSSIFLDTGEVVAAITPAAAGRVMRYALNYDNIIYENRDTAGRILTDPRDPWSYGGYQIDIGPELRGIPRHDELWRGQYSWHVPGPYSARVTSKPDMNTGVQLTKEFVMDPENGDLGIVQTMKNISDQDVSYCLWDRTLCLGGGFAIVPVNRRSIFKNGWAQRVGERNQDWRYDGDAEKPREVEIMRGHVIIQCQGPATKIGVDSTEGWVAYARGRLLFVKYFPYFPEGRYTDGGCSVEVYFNEQVAELEPLSPEVTLKPGEEYSFPEQWVLIELDRSVNTHRDARKILSKIPPSPFAR